MTARATLERLGFDPNRLSFTLRTALAACCAVIVAWLAGLEHPQWSGMTVWAASLPIRGHLLERSAFRLLGTILGALIGMALLLAAKGQLWILVTGLALWIGLCAGAGNIVRGFASYGAMLAGYSAAMVTLLHSGQSDSVFAVATDRMLTVLLGVLAGLAIGWAFAVPNDADALSVRLRDVTRRVLKQFADHLNEAGPPTKAETVALLSEIGAIEDLLDGHAAGSLRSRKSARAIHHLLLAHVGLLLWMHRRPPAAVSEELYCAIRDAAGALNDDQVEQAAAALERAASFSEFDPVLKDALAREAEALAQTPEAAIAGRVRVAYPATLHRNWVGAREAAMRTTFVCLATGSVWLLTGWDAGAFILLGGAIMTTVFSTAEKPAKAVVQALLGQILGVSAALACRWLVWPFADSELSLVLSMMPFVVFGGVLFAHHRASNPIGFDYNMIVLLMLQPQWPLEGSFTHSLSTAAAVVLGPGIGLLAFLLVFPVNGQRRMRAVVAMMIHDIEAISTRRGASVNRVVWLARFYHRALRLVRLADKTGADAKQAADGCLALVLAGSAALHLDEMLRQSSQSSSTTRLLSLALARLSHVGRDPVRAARSLMRAANLQPCPGINAELLREAAVELKTQATFIRMAS